MIYTFDLTCLNGNPAGDHCGRPDADQMTGGDHGGRDKTSDRVSCGRANASRAQRTDCCR